MKKRNGRKTYNYRKPKSVLQNKPMSFRPDNESKAFLKLADNKNKIINEALKIYKLYKLDIHKLLDYLSLRYPYHWRQVNRANGQFITQKIKELK
ncbi:MAG: hypothetical protein ACOC1K_05970 [Nanoarchaeota archaeon]